jgi:glycine cleavage system aminomethyltransferase T
MPAPGQTFDPAALVRDYGDARAEASACRADCAVFDFSFMERARLTGSKAVDLLRLVTPREMIHQPPGSIRYTLRTNPAQHVVADLTVWRLGEGEFEVFSGRHRDIEDWAAASHGGAVVTDLSADTAVIAVQGPRSLELLSTLGSIDALAALGYFRHTETVIAGVPCRVGRLGYTGERGFELVASTNHKQQLWSALTARARPAGFAAADILRVEAGYLLFANELCVPVTAAELGLTRFAAPVAADPRARLACFTAEAHDSPTLFHSDAAMRFPPAPGTIAITSACDSPLAGGVLGLGYVAADQAADGRMLADPHGRFLDVREASLPYFDPTKQRPRGPWSC